MPALSRRSLFGLPVVLAAAAAALVRPLIDPHAAHVEQMDALIDQAIKEAEQQQRQKANLVRLYDEVHIHGEPGYIADDAEWAALQAEIDDALSASAKWKEFESRGGVEGHAAQPTEARKGVGCVSGDAIASAGDRPPVDSQASIRQPVIEAGPRDTAECDPSDVDPPVEFNDRDMAREG